VFGGAGRVPSRRALHSYRRAGWTVKDLSASTRDPKDRRSQRLGPIDMIVQVLRSVYVTEKRWH